MRSSVGSIRMDFWSWGRLSTHQDDVAEPTRRQEQVDPVLNVAHLDVVARRDDTGLVEAAVQLNDDFSTAVVVDDLELANVSWKRVSVLSLR